MNEKKSEVSIQIIVAIIGATAVCIAAIIGLLKPIVDHWADNYFPTNTPLASMTIMALPTKVMPTNLPFVQPTILPFVEPTILPTQPAIAPTNNVQCSHFQVSSTSTMIPVGMWIVTRTCSPARSACFYSIEQSSGGEYSSYEHSGTADRRWVNAFCSEDEAKNFANTDAKAMLEWWLYTKQNPFP